MINKQLIPYTHKVFQEGDCVIFEIMKGDRLVVKRSITLYDCGWFRYVFGSHGTASAIKHIFKFANKECNKNLKILADQEVGV